MIETFIKIIYEDGNILVLDKPAGLSVHGDGHNTKETLVDWLITKYPEIKEVGESEVRPGIVHRLDKDTSGVMVIAKTNKAFKSLKDQFKNREVKKIYRAILVGKFSDLEKEYVIDLPIGRSKNNPKIRVASSKAEGKLRPAKTVFKILKMTDQYSYVEAYPETGRTHQLRAHFKALQHPIVCDNLYAKGKNCPTGLNRQALHAYKLELALVDGSREVFKTELPSDFKNTLDNLDLAC